uniref:hypothetical protein n=1 Tax=Paraburkholderia dipogonis TaxID=1211383 RepID=UPI0038BACDC9
MPGEHRELVRRVMLHGVPTWFFFYRGKRLGRATGWHGLRQCQAAVTAARERIWAGNAAKAVNAASVPQANGTNLGKSSPD